MLNHIVFIGRVVRTPEIRRTAKGTAVTTFTVAVDRDFKEQDGSRQSDFMDCVAWSEKAEHICTYFDKGRLVSIEGRLLCRRYTAKDGSRRKAWETWVDRYNLLDSKKNALESADELPKPDSFDLPDDFANVAESDDDLPW